MLRAAMQGRLISTVLITAVGALGLAACDAPTTPEASVSPAVEPATLPPSDALSNLLRDDLYEILAERDRFVRARKLGTLLPTLGPEAIPVVKQILEDPLLDLRGTETDLLVGFWAAREPEAAATWARHTWSINHRDIALHVALSSWAEAAPGPAINTAWPWIRELGAELEETIVDALVRGWFARNDPPELRQFLAVLPPGIPGQRAIESYVTVKLEQQGPESVEGWAESLPDEPDRTYKLTVFRKVADAVARVDVERATSWCRIHCEGLYGSSMRAIIARAWVFKDGPATMAWLATAPPGSERDYAVQATFTIWVQIDSKAATAWMKGQQTGEPDSWLAPVYGLYAAALVEEDPQEAVQWAMRIENARDRESNLIQLARAWRRKDEAAAERWLEESPLSEEARARVRAPIARRPAP
jgi:hypothetical protein